MEQEKVAAGRSQLMAYQGWCTTAAAWAVYCYLCLVYGNKLYTNVGPGAEYEFVTAWLQYVVVDNLVLSWGKALRSSILKTIIGGVISLYNRANPFVWFGAFDDDATLGGLDDIGDDAIDFNNLEADFDSLDTGLDFLSD
mmetsp:Transcript_61946/g.195789  ORF Transcript_61946/g.195789 Transcript_61946/m.195789 type:complete len:140 (-) Transcript_61946:24-443(-)